MLTPTAMTDVSSADCSARGATSPALKARRICLVAGTLGQGGAERQLFYIASALKAGGSEVLVLSLTEGEFWESRLRAIGVPVRYVGDWPSRLRRLCHIIQAARKFTPDIVQSQHFYANGYAALAGRLFHLLSIGAVRNDVSSELRDCGRIPGKLCLHLPQRLAANSRAAMRSLISLGCRHEILHLLPNVIDLKQFCPGGGRNNRVLTVLGVGRLAPQKRFDRFLRVLGLLKQRCEIPFKAVIVGDGPLRPELERMARDARLYPGTLEFCGCVSNVQAIYQNADILLLTSDHEGTPNVVMEAMACGLPVVATGVGDIPDLVQHGTSGFVVDPADEEGATRHLANLLKDDRARETMGNCGHIFIQSHHALESLSGHLARLYFEEHI
jgi:glycosyltransferase involved in cell wall biosynthesis